MLEALILRCSVLGLYLELKVLTDIVPSGVSVGYSILWLLASTARLDR